MQFSYRMKMNSADLYYSLPVGRVNLMFARVLIGLFLVFVRTRLPIGWRRLRRHA